MSRLLKIAVREYLAYVRTVGFWLSLCLTPVGLAIGFAGPGPSAVMVASPVAAPKDPADAGRAR